MTGREGFEDEFDGGDVEDARTERLYERRIRRDQAPDWSGRASAPPSDTQPYAPAEGMAPWWAGSAATGPAGTGGTGEVPPGGHDAPPYGLAYGAPPPRRRGRRALALGSAVVLVAAAGTGAALALNGGPAAGHGGTIPKPGATTAAIPNTLNVTQVAARVDPAVVDITAVDGFADQTDAGTGMILTSSGYVLTNNHVIEGATKITAKIDGKGRGYPVRVVGADPTQDVALVQLEGASGLKTVSVGNSAVVKVGQPVVAIGNALDLAGKPTVTDGIISATDRSITASDDGNGMTETLHNLLQTDAPIEPGNSGGPLVNAAGQVIGMDTAAASATSTSSVSNVGFAIPINRALAVARQIEQGHSSSTIRIGPVAFLGVEVSTSSGAGNNGGFGGFGQQAATVPGALVQAIVPNTPAARTGLAAGDVITSVDGRPIRSATALTRALAGYRPGQRVTVGWTVPAGSSQSASVTLASGPAA
jgi:S1-C subfamily serine protease